MQFGLNQEQTLLRDAVHAFTRDQYGDGERSGYRASARGYNDGNWRMLADLGVLGLLLPVADGGLGGGPRELITVMEVLGAAFAVEPVLEEIVVAANLLARAGNAEQKAAWLADVIAGKAHLAVAHFEHTARFQLSDIRLRAESRGGEIWLHGQKSVVPMAETADRWIVSAREPNSSADTEGIGFYLVSPDAAGIERRDFRMVDGSVASAIDFLGVRVNGRLPGSYQDFAAVIDSARLAAGAEMVGIMSTLFSSTVEFLKTRQQFGMPLANFQSLRHRLADLYVLLEQSRSQLFRAAACLGAGAAGERSVAGMKSYISRAALQIGEECVHLHGGIGMTDDLALGHGYKRLVLLASLYGDADTELLRFNQLAD